jgi:CHASE3 domain sensor protein
MGNTGSRGSLSAGRLGLLVLWMPFLIAGPLTYAQSYDVNAAESQSLSTYLRQHRLPLVGAQVLTDSTGSRRIVLYGFVATEFGKNDAASQALEYVENHAPLTATPQVENRIEIRPEIARMRTNAASASPQETSNKSLDQMLDDIQRYGVTMAPVENSPK